jgi:hypothetical protein
MKQLKYIFSAFVILLVLGQAAQATPLSGILVLPGCTPTTADCPAATYVFDITSTSATLAITINGGVTAQNNKIGGVNLGFVSSGNINVTGVTTNFAASGWSFNTGSLGNGGCGANAGAFICSDYTANATSGGMTIAVGSTYSWTWTYTLSSGAVLNTVDLVHVGANYNPHNGWIVSQVGATCNNCNNPPQRVPEPTSLILLGSGLAGLAMFRRRK